MTVVTQVIILLIVLAAMVMVLLAIRQLSHYEGFDDSIESSRLKEEVENDERILSKNNIFHNLVDSEKGKKTEKVYNENSKDPFSRKE